MNRQILRIALPAVVTNITVPLLALTDTAIAGHLGSAAYIGAVAVGGMLFNMAYWLFGFLRMGTGGLTARAYGAGRRDDVHLTLLRALLVALGVSVCLIVLQVPVLSTAFRFVDAPMEVKALAARYFHILIWGAPAVLGLYGFSGWFLGMQNSRTPMLISLVQNVVNIVVSCTLVFAFRRDIDGIAAGTLTAQYVGLLLALLVWRRRYPTPRRSFRWQRVADAAEMKKFFRVNTDIFLRTLCLIAVTTTFTAYGAAEGALTLAANTLLMQLFVLFSYAMDGFAYAGEALGGRFYGSGDAPQFRVLARRLFVWGSALAVVYTLVYAIGGESFLRLLTDKDDVLRTAARYLPWAVCIPPLSFAAFLFDGLFIGGAATRQMLWSMATAAATFFLVVLVCPSANTVLWSAFLAYLFGRGAVQLLFFPQIIKNLHLQKHQS